MAMSDEAVTDEVLVAELERLRRTQAKSSAADEEEFLWMAGRRGRPGAATATGEVISWVSSGLSDEEDSPLHSVDSSHTLVDPDTPGSTPAMVGPSPSSSPASEEEEEALWHTARRAVLCCREIVRTERRYQSELAALLAGRTTTPPPPLMQHYLPALLGASQRLLKGLSEDPSAWGVATAFVACEEEIEEGMVAWAGVVGQFFAGESIGGKAKRAKSKETIKTGETGKEGSTPSKSSLWRNRSISILSRTTTGSVSPPPPPLPSSPGDKEKEKEHRGKLRKSRIVQTVDLVGEGQETSPSRREKKFTVGDLAIQPTQRVMRYVMLYRDLLAHTPATSPSHALVEAALMAAQRMALKCDRAQNNAAFLPRSKLSVPLPSTSPSLETVPENNSKEKQKQRERPKTIVGRSPLRWMSGSQTRFSGSMS